MLGAGPSYSTACHPAAKLATAEQPQVQPSGAVLEKAKSELKTASDIT